MNNTRKSIVSACVGLAAIGITAGVQYITTLNDRIKGLEDEKEIRRLESIKYPLSMDELFEGMTNRHNSCAIREWYRLKLQKLDRENNTKLNELKVELLASERDITTLKHEIRELKKKTN